MFIKKMGGSFYSTLRGVLYADWVLNFCLVWLRAECEILVVLYRFSKEFLKTKGNKGLFSIKTCKGG